MRSILIMYSLLLAVMFVLPVLVMWLTTGVLLPSPGYTLPVFREIEEEDPVRERAYILDDLSAAGDIFIRVYHPREQKVMEMNLEVYLAGVVAAEMPTSFSREALKAQAVVARTYTLKKSRLFGGSGCVRHGHYADICTDSSHCQAWKDTADEPEKYQRIYRAVHETAGEVITFNDELILSCYHSTCGGRTEDAATLWAGSELPYLQNRECPFCCHSPYYRTEKMVAYEDAAFLNRDGDGLPVVVSGGGAAAVVQVEEVTRGNRVSVLRIGDCSLTGPEARELFSLPSAAFDVEVHEEGLLFENRGFGHGVGLCQYGADGMARTGFAYEQIILYYYPGVKMKTVYPDGEKELPPVVPPGE